MKFLKSLLKKGIIILLVILGIFIISNIQRFIRESDKTTYYFPLPESDKYEVIDVTGLSEEEINELLTGGDAGGK